MDQPLLYTGAQAAEQATKWRRIVSAGAAKVSRSAICNWVARGYLKPAGLNERGHPLYTHGDLARAELATREIALRPELATRRARNTSAA